MAKPGWYPDPRGGPPRYWDGAAWTNYKNETNRADVFRPERPRRWQGDTWENGTPQPPPRRGNSAWVYMMMGLAFISLFLILVIFTSGNSTGTVPAVEDTSSAKPTGQQWQERPITSPPPETDTDGRPVACPLSESADRGPVNGWFQSGPFEYQGVPGWIEGGGYSLDFSDDRSGQFDSVTSSWVAITAIGQLPTDAFDSNPATATNQVFQCLASSYFYHTLDHRERLTEEPFTTSDGTTGWLVRENFWNINGEPVVGDQVVVVVLAEGTPGHLTVFHTEAPIDDERRLAQVATALESLRRR
ncbi:MAG: hypothetical protein CSA64_01515 [Arachnia propionica]|nr:MAG: hypothetical protein CSA64_01515 [Arachnia propionica]